MPLRVFVGRIKNRMIKEGVSHEQKAYQVLIERLPITRLNFLGNQTTTIEYSIPQSSLVELTLYDLAGKKRETLVRKSHSPGYYNFRWDGSNYASGVYIYQIKADNFVQSKKLLLIK